LKNLPTKAHGTFYDLGSGTGKAVLLAYLLFPFQEVVGIELLEPLYLESQHIQSRFKGEFGALNQSDRKLQFIQGDFLKCDLSKADVVFMHSTCFPDYIWETLAPKMEKLKKGTSVVTVTKTFESKHLVHLKSKEYGMAWGRATVHFYEKQ
jgi:SAM-dependent methyltransferase